MRVSGSEPSLGRRSKDPEPVVKIFCAEILYLWIEHYLPVKVTRKSKRFSPLFDERVPQRQIVFFSINPWVINSKYL